MSDAAAFVALRYLAEHPAEAARILERFPPANVSALLAEASPEVASRALRCAEPAFAVACLAALPRSHAAALLGSLPLGVAAALLRRADAETRSAVLEAGSPQAAAALGRVLAHPEGTAGALMNPRVVVLPGDLTVERAVERLRRVPADDLYYLYVVDREQKLAGVLTYRQLLLAGPDAVLTTVMRQPVSRLRSRARGDALRGHPGWRLYLALPVVDDDGVLLGAIHRDALRSPEVGAAGGEEGQARVALALAESVWLGLSRTLDGVLGGDRGTGRGPETREKEGAG